MHIMKRALVGSTRSPRETTRCSVLVLCFAAMAIAGCSCERTASPSATPAPEAPVTARTISPVVRGERVPGGRTMQVQRFSFAIDSLDLRAVDLGMTRDLVGALGSRGTLAVNAGFFTPENENEGLLVAEGRAITPWLESLGGGVLTIENDRARLEAGEEYAATTTPVFAIQSKPRLIVDRQINIRTDDGRRADRTALCIPSGGSRLEVFIARANDDSGEGPTLQEFAIILARAGCEQALNLDGGPSTGAAWRDTEGVRGSPPRGPLRYAIVFERR